MLVGVRVSVGDRVLVGVGVLIGVRVLVGDRVVVPGGAGGHGGLLELPLDELHTAWSTTLPTLFDTPEAVVGSVPAGAVPTS
ncbi:hypothetical protein GCM10023162_34180 [Klenkia terrae]